MDDRFYALVLSVSIPQGWDTECVICHLHREADDKSVGWLELPVADFRRMVGLLPGKRMPSYGDRVSFNFLFG